jgi:hypothetical protein
LCRLNAIVIADGREPALRFLDALFHEIARSGAGTSLENGARVVE